MLYTYGFIARPETNMDLSLPIGIRNPVQILGSQSLQAIVEIDAFLDQLPTEDEALLDAVLHHDRVVQWIFRAVPILPLRFGSQFSTLESLETYLQNHEILYGEQLKQFCDRAEFSLAFVPRSASESLLGLSTPTEKGRAFFLAKKQRLQEENDRLERQQTQWKQLKQNIKIAYPQSLWSESSEGSLAKVHLLLSFKRYPHLEKQIIQWEENFSEWELHLSNPLPPYHFVTWE